jgi:hypothetical protein
MTTQIFARLALTAATTLAATAVLTAQPQSAHAANFTVGGTQYDITTVTGTFDDLSSTLTNPATAPWWGNRDLAFNFASEVGLGLGINNYGFGGPIFAWKGNRAVSGFLAAADGVLSDVVCNTCEKYVYATATAKATPVPTPALLPGFLGMGIAAYRKRKLASSTIV